ncbi:uncharacterized protein LOC128553845, partial [Mercenaria mercenaria]|uniref:uncharacterized protein LOC128553845 n=1 Tax=Mercenaria mercenaria TaxID=6596 RepID=UPI00234F40BD
MSDSDKTKPLCYTERFVRVPKVPFGLCNPPVTFERLMEYVLAGLQWQICLVYLDDIIVIGKTFAEMIENLDKVFKRFEDADLKFKAKKICSDFAIGAGAVTENRWKEKVVAYASRTLNLDYEDSDFYRSEISDTEELKINLVTILPRQTRRRINEQQK